VVCDGKMIGEGYHCSFGNSHAEANAIQSVTQPELLSHSTLYVNLEPCAHHGKTPPCAKLIIEKKIPRVVIANVDPNPKVAGRGIKMLQDADIEVVLGVLAEEGEWLNRRFFTFQRKRRPYIFLKWAQSADGFLDRLRADNNAVEPVQLSSDYTKLLVHKSRTEESAIMVGTNTAIKDNPKLTAHRWIGKNPVRVAVDRRLRIPPHYHLFDGSAPTLIYTEQIAENKPDVTYININFAEKIIEQIMDDLYRRNILSVIVEGGHLLFDSFIKAGMWDEARIETAPVWLGEGIVAPRLTGEIIATELYGQNQIVTIRRMYASNRGQKCV